MNNKMMVINQPKAFEDDKVLVANYRAKNRIEEGIISDVTSDWHGKNISHVYRVRLVRKSPGGNYIFLTVGDEAIELSK